MADMKKGEEALKGAANAMIGNINRVRSFFGREPVPPAPKPATPSPAQSLSEKMVGKPVKKEEFK